jgi:hypothetical protein
MRLSQPALFAGVLVMHGAAAHHGIVNFDLNRDIEIRGVIADLAFVNPHSWLYVDVTGPDGTVTPWRCELRSATVLRRSGWSPEMFPVGLEVVISGAPDRNTPTDCYLSTIMLPDGRSMDRYGQLREPVPVEPVEQRVARLPNGQPNISGDWAGEQRVMTDPRGLTGTLVPVSVAETLGGEMPAGMRAFPGARGTPESLADDPIRAAWSRPTAMPLTDAGRRAAEGFDPASTDNPRLRCEATNILFDWMFDTPVHRITQYDDRITIEYGTVGGLERTIWLEPVERPPVIEPTLAGYSTGRWDDDVLIVQTSHFRPGVLSADGYTMHSGELRVVERYTLDTERWALTRAYVAEDPLYFEGQYTGTDTVFISDLPYQHDVCDDRSFRVDDLEAAAAPEEAAEEVRPLPWWRFLN